MKTSLGSAWLFPVYFYLQVNLEFKIHNFQLPKLFTTPFLLFFKKIYSCCDFGCSLLVNAKRIYQLKHKNFEVKKKELLQFHILCSPEIKPSQFVGKKIKIKTQSGHIIRYTLPILK